MKRGVREGGFGIGELHARLVCRTGRGGEGARCPVLVRVSGSGLDTGRGIMFGRLEGEGGEMGVGSCLGAAREILGVLEERFQGKDGEEGKEQDQGNGRDAARERTRSCEVGKRESVTCCEVKGCDDGSERVDVSVRVSCEVSESGVIRLDSPESGQNEVCRC